MKTIAEVRPSPIAGRWYPADPQRLATSIDRYINDAHVPELKGQVVAVVAPHAGHIYSGPVAGYSFAALRGLRPDIVAVIAPMHDMYMEPLLTTAHAAYATPLGTIPVAEAALQALDAALKGDLGFGLARVPYDMEHSLEIELPFLQRVLSSPFQLLPVMMREQSSVVAQGLGRALARTLTGLTGQTALLVASTDLSHFYQQADAEKLDKTVLRCIEQFDPQGVIRAEERGEGFACGRGALAAVLWAAKELGADHAQVLHYATSGNVTGDYGQVVGYGAAVVTKQAG